MTLPRLRPNFTCLLIAAMGVGWSSGAAAQAAEVAGAAASAAAANPYGLETLWRSSDWIAKAVLLILLIMSVGSWYITIVKVLEQAKVNRQARAAAKTFWSV